MFVCAQGTPLPLSWMMLGTNGTALSLGSDDPYQAWHDYEKKGSFDSGNFMRYVQHCVIYVQCNITPTRWFVFIIDGINTHLSHETIQNVWYIFTVFYVQVTDIPTTNDNGPFYCFVIFCKVRTNKRPLPDAPSVSAVLRS